MRSCVRATITVAAALIAVAPASAAVRLRHLATGSGPALTDGRRFAAFRTEAHVVVFDTERGTRRVFRAPVCPSSYPYDALDDVGTGVALWSGCAPFDQPRHIRVMDLRTGRRLPVAGLAAFKARWVTGPVAELRWTRVGSYWLEALVTASHYWGYPYTHFVYLNWRTGATRRDPESDSVYIDLDRPALVHRLCPGVHRPRNPNSDDLESLPPFRASFRFGQSHAAWGEGDGVVTQACGEHGTTVLRPVRLTPAYASQPFLQLGVGYATVGPRLFDLSSPALAERTVVGLGHTFLGSALTHTATRLFGSANTDQEEWRISWARLPRSRAAR